MPCTSSPATIVAGVDRPGRGPGGIRTMRGDTIFHLPRRTQLDGGARRGPCSTSSSASQAGEVVTALVARRLRQAGYHSNEVMVSPPVSRRISASQAVRHPVVVAEPDRRALDHAAIASKALLQPKCRAMRIVNQAPGPGDGRVVAASASIARRGKKRRIERIVHAYETRRDAAHASASHIAILEAPLDSPTRENSDLGVRLCAGQGGGIDPLALPFAAIEAGASSRASRR